MGVRFDAAPRKIYSREKRTNTVWRRSIEPRFHRGIGDRSKRRSERVENLFPPSTIGDRRFVSIRSRTIRLYFQQDDSISSNLGKLGERWERRGKVEGPCLSPLGRKLMEYSEENGEQW